MWNCPVEVQPSSIQVRDYRTDLINVVEMTITQVTEFNGMVAMKTKYNEIVFVDYYLNVVGMFGQTQVKSMASDWEYLYVTTSRGLDILGVVEGDPPGQDKTGIIAIYILAIVLPFVGLVAAIAFVWYKFRPYLNGYKKTPA